MNLLLQSNETCFNNVLTSFTLLKFENTLTFMFHVKHTYLDSTASNFLDMLPRQN